MKSPAHNSFLQRLERNSPEDTLAMRDQIVALLDSPGWAFVKDLLDGRVEAIRGLMEHGVHEQAEYASMAAEIRGINAIVAAAEAIEEAADRADKALEQAVGLMASGSEA